MSDSATIKIHLPNGDPKRLRLAEISNWPGLAIAAPRSDLDEFLSQTELQAPGIYFLIGIDPANDTPKAYIGEGEDLSVRLRSQKNKDFWNTAIAFVVKDQSLTKAHIKYLEGRVIKIAKDIGRFQLENSQSSGAVLPRSDRSDMEVFLGKISQLLPVLGVDILTPIAHSKAGKSPRFRCSVKGILAWGDLTPNGFVVYKGSTAAPHHRASAAQHSPSTITLREKLKENGTLVERSGFLKFTKDTEFASPSAAAAVVLGGSGPGPLLWKDAKGRTLKEIEESN